MCVYAFVHRLPFVHAYLCASVCVRTYVSVLVRWLLCSLFRVLLRSPQTAAPGWVSHQSPHALSIVFARAKASSNQLHLLKTELSSSWPRVLSVSHALHAVSTAANVRAHGLPAILCARMQGVHGACLPHGCVVVACCHAPARLRACTVHFPLLLHVVMHGGPND